MRWMRGGIMQTLNFFKDMWCRSQAKKYFVVREYASLLEAFKGVLDRSSSKKAAWELWMDKAERLVKPCSAVGDVAQSSVLLTSLSGRLKELVRSKHPFLNTINNYYISSSGKYLRPLLVLLMARIVRPPVNSQLDDAMAMTPFQKLAEITELIHTASLLHDDVLDSAVMRRHQLSANLLFGNKAAILSGDFLLSRASIELARLGNPSVVESMSRIIGDLVEGEFMQLESAASQTPSFTEDANSTISNFLFSNLTNISSSNTSFPVAFDSLFARYLEKSFRKTASLMAHSCESVAILANAGHSDPDDALQDRCFKFGKLFGVMFQLIDDRLDYVVALSSQTIDNSGKAAGLQDLKNGILTAPFLYALKDSPEPCRELISRSFSGKDDMSIALELVRKSNGLEQTLQYCHDLKKELVDILDATPCHDPEARTILENLVDSLLYRDR